MHLVWHILKCGNLREENSFTNTTTFGKEIDSDELIVPTTIHSREAKG